MTTSLELRNVRDAQATHELNQSKEAQPSNSNEAPSRDLVLAPDYVSVSGTLELMKLIFESAQEDKKNLRTVRKAVDKTQVDVESAQLAEMKSAADSRLNAALTDAIAQGVGAAVTAVGVGFDAHAMSSATATARTADQLRDAMNATSDTSKWLAVGKDLGLASGKLIGGLYTHSGAAHDIAAKREEMRANALARSSAELKSDIDDVKQHSSKMFDLVREIEDSMNRCTQIALQAR